MYVDACLWSLMLRHWSFIHIPHPPFAHSPLAKPRTPTSVLSNAFHPDLRHDASRRQPGRRRQLLAPGQAADHRATRPAGLRLHRRGLSAFATTRTRSIFSACSELNLQHSRVCAFGMTRRKGAKPEDDPGMRALLESARKTITIVGKTSALSCDRSAARHARRKSGDDRRHGRATCASKAAK